jgi:uncharacterized protein (DUF427 family)
LEPTAKRIRVELGGRTIGQSARAYRVLETSHPPVYYPPWENVAGGMLVPAAVLSVCEWKVAAVSSDVVVAGRRSEQVAWSHPNPTAAFALIAGQAAFYAGRMDACWVDDERVPPQPDRFSGSWITSDVVGPFRGEPGSWGR